ncbi:MAG: DUF5686 family protein [Dysgonamonadaceae bacterium]|nr:DUF5686 family protein [Dysgonamonadaceae bacterium]
MAQSQPSDIRYGVIGMRALRFHPDATDASEIMQKVFQNKFNYSFSGKEFVKYELYQKTSIDIVINKESLDKQLSDYQVKNNFTYRYFIRPFEPWLKYACPLEKNPSYLAITTLLSEDYKTIFESHKDKRKGSVSKAFHTEGLYESIGQQNVSYLLDEVFGNIDFYRDENEILSLKFKSPLGKDARKTYSYKLVGTKNVAGKPCYEVAFYCENMKENTFSGCFYISTDGNYSLIEAKFTLNNPSNMNFLQNILITQTYVACGKSLLPRKKVCLILLGDDVKGCLIADRTIVCNNFDFTKPDTSGIWKTRTEPDYLNRTEAYWNNIRQVPLTPSQSRISELIGSASKNPSFNRIQNMIPVLLNNHLHIGGIKGPVETGPLTQFVSYNNMEGLRLKLGGNTTVNLFNQWLLGGYVAYGFKDRKAKYRADIIYSLYPRDQYLREYPKKLISFTYVNDMNIPGQNLLTTNRDHFAYSFSHASTNNMSFQKIGLLTFENEPFKYFSYKIGGQFKYDEPKGVVRYMKVRGTDTAFVSNISTSEIQLSARFSPGEKFIQTRDKRVSIRKGDIELNLSHRIGIKGLFGSDYNYRITEFRGYKRFHPGNSGTLDFYFSAGKIWNRVPLPLLFILQGNQSYIFEEDGYNCMNFYEFTTDNYVAGNVNFMFNWSPFRLFNPGNKIKTSLGTRIIYGPLSDNNNPAFHPELFSFNLGINPLGTTPYSEVNIGFANIFKFLRIEYARRLSYLNDNKASNGHQLTKGSLLLTGSFSF